MMTFLYRLYQLLIFFPFFIVVTILVALTTALGCMVGLSRWFAFGPSRFWGWFTIRALFLPVKVEGREHLQRGQSYIFAANSPNTEEFVRTIAHEVGHGIFTLQHTFDAEYGKGTQDTTNNLLDYTETGKELAAFQWNIMANPALFTAADKAEEGKKVKYTKEVGRNVTRGLAPDGRVIVSWQSKSEDYYIIPTISKDSNAIRGFHLYKVNETEPIKKFYWNDKTYATTAGETIENCPEIILSYYSGSGSIKTTIYELVGDECAFRYADVLYNTKNNKIIEGKKHWTTKRLWNASSSCYASFIQDIKSKTEQECGSEDIIAKERSQLNKAVTSNFKLEDLEDLILSSYLSSLRSLPYTSIEKLIQKVTSQETLDNQSELVVLRLMNAINGRYYPHFYSLLEANNNKLLKFLVREMDDASILFWTNDNYTNFIGALVWMFNSDNCKSIINRLPNNAENYAQRVVNLKPITYEAPKATLWEISWSTKHNDGKYDNETGNIELRDIYTTYSLKTDPYGENHITELPHEVPIISLPPLTPIIIVPEDDRLPLIQTALSGGGLSNQMYIVPAIFLKYRFDKIRNDKIEKGVVTTLDVATIVLSGGTALATKVHWIRRAWALAEVVGAVGNIAVNTRAIRNPEVQKLVGIYNSAMALIGIKNAGVAGYKFVKELPEETKNLLRKSGELRHMLSERYKIWKGQKAKLGNNISASEQQLLAQQEKAWEKLEISTESFKSPSWVEIEDVANKVKARLGHVLRIEVKGRKFTGCHNKGALDDYVSKNPGTRYELRNKVMDPSGSGVYEATPVIILEDGTEIIKRNNRGKSTFFPDDWSEERILQEVQYAVIHNQGKFKGGPPEEYWGFSSSGIEIHFYYVEGEIRSFFPVKQ